MSVTTKHTKRELPPGWRWVRLGDVCEQDRSMVEPKSETAAHLSYLGLEDIESQTGRILKATIGNVSDEGISTTFAFDDRHVLYGKLRPYLNKVALPDFAGRCTTEIIPLLPTPALDKDYLCWLLRRTETVTVAMRDITGSRMPRADMAAILKHEIPLPPLAEQQRITGVLKEQMAAVDTARAAAEERMAAVKVLPAAFLRQVFPLPGKKLPEGWRWITLGTMISETRNGFGRRPQPGEDGPIVLRLADVSKGFIDLSEPRRGVMSDKEFMTYSLHAGDILFVRVNGSSDIVGRSIIVEPDHHRLVFNDHLIRVRLNDKLLPKYLRVYCDAPITRQHFMDSASTSAGQLTINRDSLDSMPLPLPPLLEQRSVVAMLKDKMDSAEKARAAAEAELAAINALPATLLRRAFNGEL